MELAERLKPFENQFYLSLEQDLTSRDGFQYRGEGQWTTAPDWNPDPEIECGQGLHTVKRHPLFSHKFVTRKTPRYFQIQTIPDPPVESSTGGKFRAQSILLVREITEFSPEFDSDLLADLAKNASDWHVRQAAVNKLDASAYSDLLADLAKNDDDRDVCLAALNKLDASAHANFLADLAKNASDWHVSQAAKRKLQK